MFIDFRNTLVLAPHTDDAELGCGGLINKLRRNGHRVTIAVLSVPPPPGTTQESHVLFNEMTSSLRHLDVSSSDLIVKKFQHRIFSAQRQEILDHLIQIRLNLQPSLILFPNSDDKHQDHQAVYQEARRAFKHNTLLGYELPWNSHKFSCDVFCLLSNQDVIQKVKALGEYNSQSAREYFQNDFIKSLARVRGAMAGTEFAESFENVRVILK